MVTIKVSQKHVERFIFSMVIIILLGLLVNEKYTGEQGIVDSVTGHSIKSLLPLDSDITNIEPTNLEATTTTVGETTTTTTVKQATTTSTTTTTLAKEISFEIRKLDYNMNGSKAKLNSVKIDLINGLDKNANIEVRLYIYDIKSSSFQRTTPIKPIMEFGIVKTGTKVLGKEFDLDRYIFNLDEEKTFKFELYNLDKSTETPIDTIFDNRVLR